MAERKSGPIKPPTIDMTARAAKSDKPAAEDKKAEDNTTQAATDKPAPADKTPDTKGETPGANKAEKPAAAASGTRSTGSASKPPRDSRPADTPKPPPPRRSAFGGGLIAAGLAGALLGGAIGFGGAYGLAYFGYWPGAGNSDAVAALREDVSSLYVKRSDVGTVVDRAVGAVSSDVSDLETRIAALESAEPQDVTPQLEAVDERIGTLESGLNTLGQKLDAAVISGGDQAATEALAGIDERMKALDETVAALQQREAATPESVSAVTDQLGDLKDQVSSLAGVVAAIQAEPAPEPVDLRLPLALSGLTEALETGAPFVRELGLVRAALPALEVPNTVAAVAADGLGSPSALEARFLDRVPDMLAAKPSDESASWSDQALDRLKALVALRPVGSEDDATPEGLVSRIEAALAARDYDLAEAAFAALPQPMQAAAGTTGADIERFAATADLVSRARSAALELAGAQS